MFMPLNSRFCLFSFSVQGGEKGDRLTGHNLGHSMSALVRFYSFQVSGLTFIGHCTYGHSRLRLIENVL